MPPQSREFPVRSHLEPCPGNSLDCTVVCSHFNSHRCFHFIWLTYAGRTDSPCTSSNQRLLVYISTRGVANRLLSRPVYINVCRSFSFLSCLVWLVYMARNLFLATLGERLFVRVFRNVLSRFFFYAQLTQSFITVFHLLYRNPKCFFSYTISRSGLFVLKESN